MLGSPVQLTNIPVTTLANTTPSSGATLAAGNSNDVDLIPTVNAAMTMYLLDACEDMARPGTLYFIGKVYIAASKSWDSICLHINNVKRCVYVPIKQPTSASPEECMAHLSEIARGAGISQSRVKLVSRRYGFEDAATPHGLSQWLKVKYDPTMPTLVIPENDPLLGTAYHAKQSLLEMVMLKRSIRGPIYVAINSFARVEQPISWCKYEVETPSYKHISPTSPPPNQTFPALKGLSVSFKTLRTDKGVEIVAACGITSDMQSFSVLRKLDADTDIPVDMMASVQSGGANAAKKLEIVHNEKALLSYFMAKLYQVDPDYIVGYNIAQLDLDVLYSRLKALKIPHFSRLGRLIRKDTSTHKYSVICGRLLVDTFFLAREHLREKTLTLSNLAQSLLGVHRDDIENTYDVTKGYFAKAEYLQYFVRHMENDAYINLTIVERMNAIALTREIASLSGSLWSRVLLGGRAERIDSLLSHEFHKRKYVIPEKVTGKSKKDKENDSDDPQYEGGLVLEPKRGYYDNVVILLDFNSLYPSIIREYSICHSTVDRAAKQVDPGRAGEAVLPQVIGKLVEARREVKRLLKDKEKQSTSGGPNAAAVQADMVQLETRQKAIKLIANSMYGCLGFTMSRYYAQPVAELITSLGRQTLQQAVSLAQQQNLEVIYGDTDSIMIHTSQKDINEAKRMADALKKEINKSYKFLEIDLDAVFTAMLLLRKKKYAAVKIVDFERRIGKEEMKGLDMVRRDWSVVSAEASRDILHKILGNMPREELVDWLHAYLRTLAADVRGGRLDISKFVITKGIQKNPEEYPSDRKALPHVAVAQRLKANGKPIRPGDRIEYVMCKEGPFAPEEMLRGTGGEIDAEWYLSNQIHGPVARLCEHVQGTSTALIAEALGLDANKYRVVNATTGAGGAEDELLATGLSAMEGLQRLRQAARRPWLCRCNRCNQEFEFTGVVPYLMRRVKEGDAIKEGLFACSLCASAPAVPDAETTLLQARQLIRGVIGQYYDGYVRCSELGCSFRTRAKDARIVRPDRNKAFVGVCAMPSCRGGLIEETSAKDVYDQLVYLESLFDVDNGEISVREALLGGKGHKKEAQLVGISLGERERHLCDRVHHEVRLLLERSKRGFVSLGGHNGLLQCFASE
jgi:DNA polymerase alpha subunit A